MILSDEQVDERLSSPDNIINLVNSKEEINQSNGSLVVKINEGGVGKRGDEIHSQIRKLIASTVHESDETQKEIANVFGVTDSLVSQVSRGLVHNRVEQELLDISTKTKVEKENTAHDNALDNLVGLLGIVKDTLPGITSAKEASRIAVDMSRIITSVKPREDESKVRTLVVIKLSSDQKKESQFETIDV